VIKIKTTTEPIESKGGLLLAGKLTIKAGLHKIHSAAVKNAAAIIIGLYGLMMEGKTDYRAAFGGCRVKTRLIGDFLGLYVRSATNS
jgi:hypothetical protein